MSSVSLYEYRFVTSGWEGSTDFAAMSTDVLSQEMAQGLAQLQDPLTNGQIMPEEGAWEVVSHSLNIIGPHVVVSFLHRRMKV